MTSYILFGVLDHGWPNLRVVGGATKMGDHMSFVLSEGFHHVRGEQEVDGDDQDKNGKKNACAEKARRLVGCRDVHGKRV